MFGATWLKKKKIRKSHFFVGSVSFRASGKYNIRKKMHFTLHAKPA